MRCETSLKKRTKSKVKRSRGVFGLDTLWQAGIAITIFAVVLVIGARIFGGMNTTYSHGVYNGTPATGDECFGYNQTGACSSALNNVLVSLVTFSSWTNLIAVVIAGVVILGLVMGVAYMFGRGGGGTQ